AFGGCEQGRVPGWRVLAVCNGSGVGLLTGLGPTQGPAPLHASVCVQALPSLHAAVVNEATGHAALAPSHVPFTSQTFPSLQVVPAAVKVQLAVQQLLAAPFEAPRSQSSPESSTPFPQSG